MFAGLGLQKVESLLQHLGDLDGEVVQSALHLLQAVCEADVEGRRALGQSGVRNSGANYGRLLRLREALTALGPWEFGSARLDAVLRKGKIIQRLVLEQVL